MYLGLSHSRRYVMMTKRESYAIDCDAALARSQLRQAPVFRTTFPQVMSVLLETSLGDITIDLLVDDAPKCCEK